MAEKTRHDKSSAKSKYPYNKVFETLSGHTIHMDDTPGAERIFIRHASGTYTEISADGKVVNYTVGDTKNYGKGGVSFTVDENCDIKMSGHARFLVGGGAHIETAGDAGIVVGGDTALVGMGKVNVRAKSAYVGTDGDLNMNVGGNMDMQIKGTTTINSGGNMALKAPRIDLN